MRLLDVDSAYVSFTYFEFGFAIIKSENIEVERKLQ